MPKSTECDPMWSADYTYLWEKLPRCLRCKRKLRPSGSDTKSWPSTVARASTQVCAACVAIEKKAEVNRLRIAAEAVAAAAPGAKTSVAQSWSMPQRSVAVLVAERVALSEVRETLDVLGLLDPAPLLGGLSSPTN